MELWLKFRNRKKRVMTELHDRIKMVENNVEVIPDLKYLWKVIYNNGTYIAQDELGHEVEVTLGDIMTDASWNIGYALDPETVPRTVRKDYVIERAKNKLSEFLDAQILHTEKNKENNYQESFKAIAERHENMEVVYDLDQGHLGEIFVKNYLRKLAIDGILPIEINGADVFEDVVDKIDFFVRIKKHIRGVEIESTSEDSENSEDIAVQFTLMSRKTQVLNKRKIMTDAIFDRGLLGDANVDDVALLYLHERYIRRAIGKWKYKRLSEDSSSPIPGGPEKLFEDRGQREVLHRLFDDLLGEEYIDGICVTLNLENMRKPVEKL